MFGGDVMPGLLYPAYQKLYSALSSLERFNKEENFFDNITAIDNFFNEYRNITFVLQSTLKHTEFFSAYEKNRDTYLADHWFVEKRNETIKQKPFQLIKEIVVTLYLPFGGFDILEKKFSVENDTPLESLLFELKETLCKINKYEVCFSVSFSFHEANSNIDLLSKLLQGTSAMKRFMEAMESDIGEECNLCNQLKDKIESLHFTGLPLDFLSVNDYVYYPEKDTFDRAQRISLSLGIDGGKVINKATLSSLTNSDHFNYDGTAFSNFTLSHIIIQSMQKHTDIMPVIMVVYDDDTFDLDAFSADMKTTMYRKINETAKLIDVENVAEVCFLSLYTSIQFTEDAPKYSLDRIKLSSSEFLVSSSVNKKLEEKEYVFNRKNLTCMDYIAYVMKNGRNNYLNISAVNMLPIKQAFEKKFEIL